MMWLSTLARHLSWAFRHSCSFDRIENWGETHYKALETLSHWHDTQRTKCESS